MLIETALIVAAYLLGSISSAVVVCRAFGYGDPRATGSGNPGATNVLRSAGRSAALLTLAGDVAKGLLPVLAAQWLEVGPLALGLTALAAFAGHLFPVFFGFRGGKGVATYIGALFGIGLWPGLAFIGIWLLVAAIARYSSLAALSAAAASPVLALWFGQRPIVAAILLLMTIALFYRHRDNIGRLRAGTESRIGKRVSASPGDAAR
jgi:glycerol-3-phosphate acyltransferase PlsY